MADLSESMRLTLRDGAEKIVSRVTTGIEQGEVEKCLPACLPNDDARYVAETRYQLWLGASLLNKLQHTGQSFRTSMATTKRLLGA
ncbi:hypothetical protein [Pseudomonas umsongensis]|uniref:hypothetical protein n=1 Tax=Pseudomonas umsongensis TaxID=198618 RepID=UPI001CDC9C6F|nr:hypothetical protein [Pseudomonas umsongensis]